jgi:NADH-quinone oxidoreductase subunit K
MSALALFQVVSLFLMAVGFYGIAFRRSFVGMLICVELLLNGAGLGIVAAGQLTEANPVLAQLSTLLVMGLAAAEACLVLAIIIVVAKRWKSVDPSVVSELKG